MSDKILDAIELYLAGNIDIDSLEDSVIPLAWESKLADRELLHKVMFEFIYFKDGLSDESDFRERVAGIASEVGDAADISL